MDTGKSNRLSVNDNWWVKEETVEVVTLLTRAALKPEPRGLGNRDPLPRINNVPEIMVVDLVADSSDEFR